MLARRRSQPIKYRVQGRQPIKERYKSIVYFLGLHKRNFHQWCFKGFYANMDRFQ